MFIFMCSLRMFLDMFAFMVFSCAYVNFDNHIKVIIPFRVKELLIVHIFQAATGTWKKCAVQ